MKKILLLFIFAPLLSFCSPNKIDKEVVFDELIEVTHHNYYEIVDFAISWSNMFDVELPEYYLYFYSPTCSHCSDLRDWIIDNALTRRDIYFVKESSKDKISKDTSKTVGATRPEDVTILGYPSMIKIIDKIVINYAAGKTQIQELLK